MSDFLQSNLEIKINEFFEKYVDGKTVTFYKIEVYDNFSKDTWYLEKRYSEIDLLHKTISKLYPNIPPMPGKTLFKIKDRDQLEKRKKQLETFLRECTNRKDIVSNESFKGFLEIDKHSPDMTYNPPTIIYENNELPLGVRDFFFFEEGHILFLVCCDMNITSRVDAYITNVNLPWEKNTGEHISVGAVFAFKVIEDKRGNSYYFEKLWAKSFPEQTGVVNFNKKDLVLQVGLDSGTIIFYKTSVESKYIAYDEIVKYKPHIDRVMGLSYDEQKGYIYSCSTDKKLKMTEFNNISNVNELCQSAYGFTALIHDKPNERLFLTNEGGALYVFSTNEYPPILVITVQTHTFNCIRGLDIEYHKQYIFTGTNKGDISILDLGNPGKEKLIKEISYFGGNLEIRIIRYNPENHELYSGDQKGKITVWSLRTGQSIYAWQAHSGAITQMRYDRKKKQLLSVGKDKKIIYWQIPNSWVSESMKKFEEDNMREINASRAAAKFQKIKKEKDDDDSSEDSLDGWDIRP
jgi:WD40 repeat protein